MKIKNLREMANRIKSRRKELGYTQESFCETADLSISSYTKIENAFQNPSLDTVISIAQHLNVSLDYLIFGDDGDRYNNPANMDIISVVLKGADKSKLLYALDIFSRISKEME